MTHNHIPSLSTARTLPLHMYLARQDALLARFSADQKASGLLCILSSGEPSIRNRDVEYPFRPNNHFFYLTGLYEPKAHLCLIVHNGTITRLLFAQKPDFKEEIWHGRRLGFESAAQQVGAQGFDTDAFAEKLPILLAQLGCIAFDFQDMGGIGTHIFTNIARLEQRSRNLARPAHQCVNMADHLADMRLYKDVHEVAILQKSNDIAILAHSHAMQKAQAGMHEYQLEAILQHTFTMHGAQNLAYSSIVASGDNACILHHRAGDRILQNGELCLIDAGCDFNGYASDITRTFPVNRAFSKAQADIYDIVAQALLAATQAAQVGAAFDAPHQVALDVVIDGLLGLGILPQVAGVKDRHAHHKQEKTYQTFFMHRTSHYLGMDVHDVGRYYKHPATEQALRLDTMPVHSDMQALQAGMVMTIEPGIYIHPSPQVDEKYWNIGIRIENDILITNQGPYNFSEALPILRQDVEALMSS